ncbi:hypothetical protein U1Q18_019108 [Sarracenia purpurea var. burkii]
MSSALAAQLSVVLCFCHVIPMPPNLASSQPTACFYFLMLLIWASEVKDATFLVGVVVSFSFCLHSDRSWARFLLLVLVAQCLRLAFDSRDLCF